MNNNIQQNICNVALVVDNYDEAIAFYTQKLRFELVGDIDLGGRKRWVQIWPPNSTGTNILLAQASNDEQKQSIGNQTGGRVFLFLQTNNFWRDYQFMKNKGVEFTKGTTS